MNALACYHAARSALLEATRVDQALAVRDEMEHVKLYARQVKDRALMADATEIQMRAERRLGELLVAAKAAGQVREGRPRRGENPAAEEGFSQVTLAEAGVDYKLSAKAQKAAKLEPEAFDAVIAGMREKLAAGKAIIVDPIVAAAKEAHQAQRRAEHQARTYDGGKVRDLRKLAASGFRAGAILVDPPWHFRARSERGEGRSAAQHYTTARDFKDVIDLPVPELAAEDCCLFLWVVDWAPGPALELIKAWKFEHKTTAFTWAKTAGEGWHMGQGYWTRANPEDCWLATCGAPQRMSAGVRQLIVAPVMEHSRKPDEVHDRIEKLVGGPYLELYARRERKGWLTWGNEIAFKPPARAAAATKGRRRPAKAPKAIARFLKRPKRSKRR